ncbi:DUF4920 domain-containing protein [Sphingobacterium sp. lm-10]|uniref:DUF4920 domain-containing protein n=1 Tax=Sphingobacterium sp. lm-10 TaxID=2944904 RepID=UPI0020206DD4|nr:DUF4920 domain-containing protein [Sphingobacterium sp. lm-10]MCL7988765.1 DUF4920 domain-containing protein [Sphingobacterium sp. lm-10]
MKKLFTLVIGIIAFTLVGSAQQADIPSANPGVQYGKKVDAQGAISVKALESALAKSNDFSGKVTGEVVQVCKKKGCFITLKREGDADPIMVRFTDYGYFMPQDIVGKTVVLEGKGKVKETTLAKLQHDAKDLGKSASEIASIKKPKRDITFIADGVVVVK